MSRIEEEVRDSEQTMFRISNASVNTNVTPHNFIARWKLCVLQLQHFYSTNKHDFSAVFSARCNIYISRLCYDVSVRLSVRLSVTEVHWHIIANLGSNSDPNLPRIAVAVNAGARERIIAGKSGGIISRYASHC